MPWGDNFAEGDSGVPIAGEGARKWQQIYEATLEAGAKPMNLRVASIAQFQAKFVGIFVDEGNKVADMLKAIDLTMRLIDQFAEEPALEEDSLCVVVARR